MSLFDQINTDIKKAMLAKDKQTLSALRDIKSKLLLEATSASDSKVTDDVVLKISKKLHKQRIETIEIYTKQGREDLAEEERVQALVIEKYLPKQLSADEIHEHVKLAIADVDAKGMQDMGKVMGLLSSKIGGMADGKTISVIVKEELS
jgi:uncharacterized protein YqeY